MWLSRRKAVFGLGALAACGFEPVYNARAQHALYGKIALPAPNSSETFALNKVLVERFGEAVKPEYALSIGYKSSAAKLNISQANIATRYRITATARIVLRAQANDEVILREEIKRIAGYSANRARFAGDQVRAATERNLAERIGETIATRIVLAIGQEDAR